MCDMYMCEYVHVCMRAFVHASATTEKPITRRPPSTAEQLRGEEGHGRRHSTWICGWVLQKEMSLCMRVSHICLSLGPSLHLFVFVCYWLSFDLRCCCRSLLSVLTLLVPPCLCLPLSASACLCLSVSVCLYLRFALLCCCRSLLSALSILVPPCLCLSLVVSVCLCLSLFAVCSALLLFSCQRCFSWCLFAHMHTCEARHKHRCTHACTHAKQDISTDAHMHMSYESILGTHCIFCKVHTV